MAMRAGAFVSEQKTRPETVLDGACLPVEYCCATEMMDEKNNNPAKQNFI
jgi:hypothetical protein